MSKARISSSMCSFELGGNAPFVVFDDANLKEAVEGAAAINLCASPANRVSAPTALRPGGHRAALHPAFVERVKAIKVGEGFQRVWRWPLI